jgi:hypothetical protein
MNILTNALIAVAAIGVVGYALMSHLQSRAQRPRQGGRQRRRRRLFGYHEWGILAWKLVLQRQFGKLHR